MFRKSFIALSLVFVLNHSAWATDVWTNPFPGIKRLHRTLSNQNINVLVIDLCASGVSIRATAYAERGQRTSSFGAFRGAQAAINGDFFNYAGYGTDGVAMSGGVQWPGTADHGYVGMFAAGPGQVDIIPHEVVAGPEPWMREIVGGHPTLVYDGLARTNYNPDYVLCGSVIAPRTAVGLTADKRTLIMAVIDGRKASYGRVGYTCDQTRDLLMEFGAAFAQLQDGGGSSTMWLSGTGVINYPSDPGGERIVGNHLAVYAKGTGPALNCTPDWRSSYIGGGFQSGNLPTIAEGKEVAGWLDFKNTGAKSWTPGITKLGTTGPRDMASPLVATGWESAGRMATVDKVVPPGGTGRFAFSLKAPDAPGVYTQYFNLLEDGVAWFSDSGGPTDNDYYVRVTSVLPDWRSEYVGGGFPGGASATINPGTEVSGYLDFKNTGAQTWVPGTTNLAITGSVDSPLYSSSWVSSNRIATIDHSVPSGSVGRFVFKLKAPVMEGTYVQEVNLVQEGVAWFSQSGGPADGVYYVTVTSLDGGTVPVDAGTQADAGTQVGLDAGTFANDGGTPLVDEAHTAQALVGGCDSSATSEAQILALFFVIGVLFVRTRRRQC